MLSPVHFLTLSVNFQLKIVILPLWVGDTYCVNRKFSVRTPKGGFAFRIHFLSFACQSEYRASPMLRGHGSLPARLAMWHAGR